MWWYNILGVNKGSISHLLRLDTIIEGYILHTNRLVELKREKSKPIVIVKRTEWRKFFGYFVPVFEAKPSIVGKKNV